MVPAEAEVKRITWQKMRGASPSRCSRPETEPALTLLWGIIRDGLIARGAALAEDLPDSLEAPESLWSLWESPRTILAQACSLPYRARLRGKVDYVITLDHALPGCPAGYYNSVVVTRPGGAPEGVLAYNSRNSQSGWAAAREVIGAGRARATSLLSTGEVHVADLDPRALACARVNAPHAPAHCGDLYAALPRSLAGRVDVVAANAPHVPTGDIALMPPEAREHEPRQALDGGPDGLAAQRRLNQGAPEWLAPDGVLLLEGAIASAGALAQTASEAGLAGRTWTDDEIGGCVLELVTAGERG